MMYLVLKTCSDLNHHSCGCQNNHFYPSTPDVVAKTRSIYQLTSMEKEQVGPTATYDTPTLTVNQQDLSFEDLSKLDSGSPLRLTKSITRRQGNSTLIITFYFIALNLSNSSFLYRLFSKYCLCLRFYKSFY